MSIARQLDVPMPVTAATREMVQAHFGVARSKPDPDAYIAQDFATLFETMALIAGVKLESENMQISDGLEPERSNATRRRADRISETAGTGGRRRRV